MWYALLILIALVTVFPFAWILLTSIKGPTDLLFSTPPQLLPHDPTFENYGHVLDALPIPKFFVNSIAASSATTIFNVLVASMAAYPLAKLRFRGREAIFYLLLATLIVPAQLTYIPSYLLARTFNYYDSLPAIILPSLASAFNIFLMRQAFRGVPNELIDAARVDGAREWRIWLQIAMPLVRPTLATVAITMAANGTVDCIYTNHINLHPTIATVLSKTTANIGDSITDLHIYPALVRQEQRSTVALGESRRRDEFLAMAGHELRNPLAPMALALEIMRQSPAPDAGTTWAS